MTNVFSTVKEVVKRRYDFLFFVLCLFVCFSLFLALGGYGLRICGLMFLQPFCSQEARHGHCRQQNREKGIAWDLSNSVSLGSQLWLLQMSDAMK